MIAALKILCVVWAFVVALSCLIFWRIYQERKGESVEPDYWEDPDKPS